MNSNLLHARLIIANIPELHGSYATAALSYLLTLRGGFLRWWARTLRASPRDEEMCFSIRRNILQGIRIYREDSDGDEDDPLSDGMSCFSLNLLERILLELF